MVNHPNRRKPPQPIKGARLARLLARIENHRIDHIPVTQSELAALVAHNDLVVTSDAGRWRLTAEGRQYVIDHDRRAEAAPVDANRIWWLVRKVAGLDDAEVVDACAAAGLDFSRSRIAGWRKHPTDRKHAKMTWEDLEQVLQALVEDDEVAAHDPG